MGKVVSKKVKMAAGGIVIDTPKEGAPRVLLVHRPRYDDWSFPKGGVDEGESLEQAAVREVKEETGIECRIRRALLSTSYIYRTRKGARRPKVVYYFLMESKRKRFKIQGDEVDRAEWFDVTEAQEVLSYDRDKKILASLFDTGDENG